ncbi:MAG: bifunctional aspartate kinase/homoserine dehydrogenase I [Gammaproteobacteria bacterium]|nr:bifunctional aspartate kinase/homoserine dehydrogenase I [Gammaproteobacteria bacterium]
MKSRWKIHKFGGSSLADADCFRRVAGLLLDYPDSRMGVVVSAMRGMTDALLHLAILAERDDDAFNDELHAIGERYSAAARALLKGDRLVEVLDSWSQDATDIKDVLKAIALVKSAPQRSRDVVAGYGEIWSARLLAGRLGQESSERGGTWIDAREILTVSQTELGPTVQWQASQAKFDRQVPQAFSGIAVITGFIAADEEGLQTTLGRNGSDYSAAIFAALSDAAELSIWSDVDGVMSADPNRVPEARVIEQLTYNEAMELAYFGARVIHPQTLGPVIENDIPVVIRNSFNPSHSGSRIEAAPATADNIKGITAISGMALVNLEGSGMIGVPGTADRLFAALKNAGVSVTLISQASSEHSICIAVPQDVAQRAKQVVSEAFADELASGQIQRVDLTESQSIVAVVGDGMAGTPGIAARFFGTLGRAGINIRAIAQGSSERNISAVVDSDESTRALRAAHSGFYLSSKTISIGLIGAGNVGATLILQLEKQARRLAEIFNLDLRVRGIARSKSMLLGDRRIDLAHWQHEYEQSSVDLDLEAFERHVNPDHLPHAVIIDCTAEESVAARYADWLQRGIHVITPNKKAGSGPIADYEVVQANGKHGSSHFFYETTVGAALPIISTLQDLIDTGDEIHSVQGIFSGTLAYLFNVYDGKTPFSAIVREARDSGYTEPDPRDDLSGMDVARKLTILAREIGHKTELGDFPVQNLVPESLRRCSIDEFLGQLAEHDDEMKVMYEEAEATGKKLRYVGRLNAAGEAAVGLESVDADHPFSNINLTDNIVQFETDRYSSNPLVVQGPGAGPEVTAGGVFSDLLRLAKYLNEGD